LEQVVVGREGYRWPKRLLKLERLLCTKIHGIEMDQKICGYLYE
jgi:hypothetical protein